MSDKELIFQPDRHSSFTPEGEARHWTVLIVDDEEDVHEATVFSLRGLIICERPLHFLHAYSAEEGLKKLSETTDIAVMLLDVVMESEHSGLELVRAAREELGLADLRIVLRTGQPGYAPEKEVIRDYDINDYRSKTELTQSRLYTTLTAAIRSYAQIEALNIGRRGLERIIRGSSHLVSQRNLDEFASGMIEQVSVLLRLNPSGMVFVQCETTLPPTRNCPFIIAATGQFERYQSKALHDIEDRDLAGFIEESFKERQGLEKKERMTLFFPNESGPSLVMLLERYRSFTATERQLLEVFCSNIAVSIENLSILRKLHRHAYYDQELDILNRCYLVQYLEGLEPQPLAQFTIIDLDYFGSLCDSLGAPIGNALLKAVVNRLTAALPEDILITRVGADQFGLFGAREHLEPERIRAIFAKPFDLAEQQTPLSITQGYVLLDNDSPLGERLLKQANVALKRAKNLFRGDALCFDPAMEIETGNQVRLLHDLKRSFNNGNSMFMAYQPQIELSTGQVNGAEALVRWRGDDGALVSPADFIPVAEASGLINPIGNFVLRTALMEFSRMRENDPSFRNLSVNVSISQLRDLKFPDTVRELLEQYPDARQWLELEITESMEMIEEKRPRATLQQLREMGVRLAIDDFGTGYSSLSYLRDLPAQRLKIDRSFISRMLHCHSDFRLVEMMLELASELELVVVAEGVEYAEEASLLNALGCQLAQGFYYARPMIASDLLEWRRSYKPEPPARVAGSFPWSRAAAYKSRNGDPSTQG